MIEPRTWAGAIGLKAQCAQIRSTLHPEASDEEFVFAYLEELGAMTPRQLMRVSGLTENSIMSQIAQLVIRGQMEIDADNECMLSLRE